MPFSVASYVDFSNASTDAVYVGCAVLVFALLFVAYRVIAKLLIASKSAGQYSGRQYEHDYSRQEERDAIGLDDLMNGIE